jgi:hypothetical protein
VVSSHAEAALPQQGAPIVVKIVQDRKKSKRHQVKLLALRVHLALPSKNFERERDTLTGQSGGLEQEFDIVFQLDNKVTVVLDMGLDKGLAVGRRVAEEAVLSPETVIRLCRADVFVVAEGVRQGEALLVVVFVVLEWVGHVTVDSGLVVRSRFFNYFIFLNLEMHII